MRKLKLYFKKDHSTLVRVKEKEHTILYQLILGIWEQVRQYHTVQPGEKRKKRGSECVFSLPKEEYQQLLASIKVSNHYISKNQSRPLPIYYGDSYTVLFVLKERENNKKLETLLSENG